MKNVKKTVRALWANLLVTLSNLLGTDFVRFLGYQKITMVMDRSKEFSSRTFLWPWQLRHGCALWQECLKHLIIRAQSEGEAKGAFFVAASFGPQGGRNNPFIFEAVKKWWPLLVASGKPIGKIEHQLIQITRVWCKDSLDFAMLGLERAYIMYQLAKVDRWVGLMATLGQASGGFRLFVDAEMAALYTKRLTQLKPNGANEKLFAHNLDLPNRLNETRQRCMASEEK